MLKLSEETLLSVQELFTPPGPSGTCGSKLAFGHCGLLMALLDPTCPYKN